MKYLKQKYQKEVVNYFYETVFYEDQVGQRDFLFKWRGDVWINFEGELWPKDSSYVLQAITQINTLNLPIKLHRTTDTSLVNEVIHFGDMNLVREKIGLREDRAFLGVGIFSDNSQEIVFAKVGIANNASSYNGLTILDTAIMRQSIIIEEITQTLGISGDSWKYYNSVFFEGHNRTQFLTEMDKEVIRLLYEPSIPAGYSRKQFEKDFKDVLYHIDAKKKILNYVKSYHVPVRYLEYIRDNCFHDDLLFKYPQRIFVKLSDDFQSEDVAFCEKAIELLNSASDQIQLKIASDDVWSRHPAINIQFQEDTTLQSQVIAERFLTTDEMMFQRRISGTIKLSFKKSDSLKHRLAGHKLLFKSMYRILGMDHTDDHVIEIDRAGEISFKPDYKEILSLLYNPVFPNGFTRQEMNDVINTLKKK